jgi:hypothetical protein
MEIENSKPEWLIDIERQSFQVELIVSGLAIYGSLALGTFLHEVSESLVLQFSDNVLFLLKFAFLYLFVAQKILLLGFITHFSLRVLWIGIVGLNSVYPQGIFRDSKVYPDHIMQSMTEEYPSISDYGMRLDRTCSVIFSILCAGIIVFTVIAIWLFIAIGISELLRTFLSDGIVYGIQIAVFTIFYLFVIILILLTVLGPYTTSSVSKKYGYRLMSALNRGFFLMFHEPYAYITYTLRTNTTSRRFMIIIMILFMISIVVSFGDVVKTFNLYQKDAFFAQNQSEADVYHRNYLDTYSGNYLLHPIIQSELIEDNYIKLFIPEFTRERKSREIICGAFSKNPKLSNLENKLARELYYDECGQSYYSIIIDKGRIGNLDFRRRRHNNKGQWGYQVIIPIDSITPGKHLLKIKMAYKNEENESASRVIPFYKI